MNIKTYTVKSEFKYNNCIYQSTETYKSDITSPEGIEFSYTEGNMSCDCNRSRIINELPDMECGETIELITLNTTSS